MLVLYLNIMKSEEEIVSCVLIFSDDSKPLSLCVVLQWDTFSLLNFKTYYKTGLLLQILKAAKTWHEYLQYWKISSISTSIKINESMKCSVGIMGTQQPRWYTLSSRVKLFGPFSPLSAIYTSGALSGILICAAVSLSGWWWSRMTTAGFVDSPHENGLI